MSTIVPLSQLFAISMQKLQGDSVVNLLTGPESLSRSYDSMPNEILRQCNRNFYTRRLRPRIHSHPYRLEYFFHIFLCYNKVSRVRLVVKIIVVVKIIN